jgi:cell surface protein SprA
MKNIVMSCLLMLSVVSCTNQKGTEPVNHSRVSCIIDYNLAISRTHWHCASQPVAVDTSLFERAHIAWYNPVETTPITEIWNRDIGTNGPNETQVLSILFKPVNHKFIRDTINNVIDSISTPIDPEKSWNGIAAYLPPAADMAQVDLLEFRIKGDEGIMHVDLGRISEDINGNGLLDTEDKDGFGVLDDDEDVGLDGLPSSLEFGFNPANGVFDPAGDDFSFDDVWRINGTEGNRDDPDGGWIPDTEDPDKDGLEIANEYFSYKIDLSDTTDHYSGFYVAGTRNEYGWKTIRIPLRDPQAIDDMVGTPSWSNIPMLRIWFDFAGPEHTTEPLKVRIAAIELQGIGWENASHPADSLRSSGRAEICFVNRDIDEGYLPPPGWSGNELYPDLVPSYHALDIVFSDIQTGIVVYTPDSGLILAADTVRADRFLELPYNFLAPARMQAFVYGNLDIGSNSDSVLVFFRMGSDPDIYYEHRALLHNGWDSRNIIDINLSEIEQLKTGLLADRQNGTDSSLVRTSGAYAVKISDAGDAPDLTVLTYFAVGIINLDPSKTASGEMWFCGLHPVY